MGTIKNDPVAVYFRSQLRVKQRKDGNLTPDVANSDCAIMLQLIRMKLKDFTAQIDPSNPGRFRSNSDLKREMARVLGPDQALHVRPWGASHHRGAFREDEKRGNKRHLIEFGKLLNNYSATPQQLQKVYDHCIREHHKFWEGFSLKVIVQQEDPFQKRLMSLLSLQSLGRAQQGLVFATLRRRYGKARRITTKKTFAGDEQSSRSGIIQRGDVQVWEGDALVIALEIKSSMVDATTWERVSATHGRHEHTLFVLGLGFRPAPLQHEISSLADTYALHLADFLLTLVFTIAADENLQPPHVLSEIVDIYNREFAEAIEHDRSIRISIDVE